MVPMSGDLLSAPAMIVPAMTDGVAAAPTMRERVNVFAEALARAQVPTSVSLPENVAAHATPAPPAEPPAAADGAASTAPDMTAAAPAAHGAGASVATEHATSHLPARTLALRLLVQRVHADLGAEPAAAGDESAVPLSRGDRQPSGSTDGASPPVHDALQARGTERGQSAREEGSGTTSGSADTTAEASAGAPSGTEALVALNAPARVVRDLETLHPAFRERITRVIARMQAEFGHEVTVAETWRGQARQELLYDQGRSREGPVVTWTRHSQHTAGRAADLVVSGGPAAYAQLAQVAREEGLRTLGARDPGHVELARMPVLEGWHGTATVTDMHIAAAPTFAGEAVPVHAAVVAAASRRTTFDAASVVAPVAPVAPVAVVASVARVAGVASLAPKASHVMNAPSVPGTAPAVRSTGTRSETREGDEGAPRRLDRLTQDRTLQPRDAVKVAAAVDAPLRETAPRLASLAAAAPVDVGVRPREERRSRISSSGAASIAELRPREPGSEQTRASSGSGPAARSIAGAVSAEAPAHSDAIYRAAHIAGLQETRDAQPVSHLMLRLDTPDGGEDRVRIAMRGTQVGATIGVRDAASAAQMSRGLPELTRALEAAGLESGSLRVQAVATDAAMPGNLVRAAAGEAISSRGTLFADSGSSFASSQDGAPDQQAQQESPRHRSRREHQEERP
ncbi:MAG: flagellar hook-length control protein FliK [Gemmatimonadaceae bacterium]